MNIFPSFSQPSPPQFFSPRTNRTISFNPLTASAQALKTLFQDSHLQAQSSLQIHEKDKQKTQKKALSTRNISYLFPTKRHKSIQLSQNSFEKDSFHLAPLLKNSPVSSVLDLRNLNDSLHQPTVNSSLLNSLEKVPENLTTSFEKPRNIPAPKGLQGAKLQISELRAWTHEQILSIFQKNPAKTSGKDTLKQAFSVYSLSFAEVLRQISVENRSQSEFLSEIWEHFKDFVEKALQFESEYYLCSEKRLLRLLERTHGSYQRKISEISSENARLQRLCEEHSEKIKGYVADLRYLKKKDRKTVKDFKVLKAHLSDLQSDNVVLVKDNVKLTMQKNELDGETALSLNEKYLSTIRNSLASVLEENKALDSQKARRLQEIINEIKSKEFLQTQTQEFSRQSPRLLEYLQDNLQFFLGIDAQHSQLHEFEDFFLEEKACDTGDLVEKREKSTQKTVECGDFAVECRLLRDERRCDVDERGVQCNFGLGIGFVKGKFRNSAVQCGNYQENGVSVHVQTENQEFAENFEELMGNFKEIRRNSKKFEGKFKEMGGNVKEFEENGKKEQENSEKTKRNQEKMANFKKKRGSLAEKIAKLKENSEKNDENSIEILEKPASPEKSSPKSRKTIVFSTKPTKTSNISRKSTSMIPNSPLISPKNANNSSISSKTVENKRSFPAKNINIKKIMKLSLEKQQNIARNQEKPEEFPLKPAENAEKIEKTEEKADKTEEQHVFFAKPLEIKEEIASKTAIKHEEIPLKTAIKHEEETPLKTAIKNEEISLKTALKHEEKSLKKPITEEKTSENPIKLVEKSEICEEEPEISNKISKETTKILEISENPENYEEKKSDLFEKPNITIEKTLENEHFPEEIAKISSIHTKPSSILLESPKHQRHNTKKVSFFDKKRDKIDKILDFYSFSLEIPTNTPKFHQIPENSLEKVDNTPNLNKKPKENTDFLENYQISQANPNISSQKTAETPRKQVEFPENINKIAKNSSNNEFPPSFITENPGNSPSTPISLLQQLENSLKSLKPGDFPLTSQEIQGKSSDFLYKTAFLGDSQLILHTIKGLKHCISSEKALKLSRKLLKLLENRQISRIKATLDALKPANPAISSKKPRAHAIHTSFHSETAESSLKHIETDDLSPSLSAKIPETQQFFEESASFLEHFPDEPGVFPTFSPKTAQKLPQSRRFLDKSHEITRKFKEPADFLIKTRLRSVCQRESKQNMALSTIYKQISSVYQEALRLYKQKKSIFCEFPALIYGFFVKKFGLKSVAEAKMLSFVATCVNFPDKTQRKIAIFLRFLGLDAKQRPFLPQEFQLFLNVLLNLDENNRLSSVVFVNIEKIFVKWEVFLAKARELFEPAPRKPDFSALFREIQRKLPCDLPDFELFADDFDVFLEILLDFYRELFADLYKIAYKSLAIRENTLKKREFLTFLAAISDCDTRKIEKTLPFSLNFGDFRAVLSETLKISQENLEEMLGFRAIDAEIRRLVKGKSSFQEKLRDSWEFYAKLLRNVEVCEDSKDSLAAKRTLLVSLKVLDHEYRRISLEELLICEEFTQISLNYTKFPNNQ